MITLTGSDVSQEVGGSYTDAGATALDNIDGDITSNIATVNPVDPSTVGVYTVTYNVSDAAGNPAVEGYQNGNDYLRCYGSSDHLNRIGCKPRSRR